MVRGQWVNLDRMPGLHLYSFSKDILGFLMTTESQDLGLTSHLKDRENISDWLLLSTEMPVISYNTQMLLKHVNKLVFLSFETIKT